MRDKVTYVYGCLADQAGIVSWTTYHGQKLPGGRFRASKSVELAHEPGSAYALTHRAPMAMRWKHDEEIGRVVALRRNHNRLLAIAACELEPDELAWLTKEHGDLRWSASTDNRRGAPLKITEISLTTHPATVGLPAVKWWRLGAQKGNLPMWVKEELERAEKTEFRFQHRGELRVHDLDSRPLDPEQAQVEGRVVGGPLGYSRVIDGEMLPIETYPGRILSVNGRKVKG